MEQPKATQYMKAKAQRKVRQVRNWHDQEASHRTPGQRIADTISNAAGSWTFLFVHVAWFFIWIVFKIESYPYGLLTMIVSLEAIFLSTFILISQNRETERDRARATEDYETNIAAKEEIEQIMTRLDNIEIEKLNKIIGMMEEMKTNNKTINIPTDSVS
jgi:uncharacterized membrane protein